MAISLTTPSGTVLSDNHNWLGLNGAYSSIMPIIDPEAYQVYGSQDMTGLVEDILGGKNFIEGISYRHVSEDRFHSPVIVSSGPTGNNGIAAVGVYTLDASASEIVNFPSSAVEPYVATGTQVTLNNIRVRDTLIFPNGAQGYVTAKTSTTFDCAITNNIALPTLTNADVIINTGVTNGEEGDSPTTYNNRDGWYYNMAEIMVDAHKSSGTALGEKLWIDYTWQGSTQKKWWFKGMRATTTRFRNFREMKWITGNKIVSATAINAFDATMTRTEGLYPFASSYNATQVFNITAGISLQDFQGYITDSIDKNNGTTEYSLISSIYNHQAVDRFIRSEMRQGGITYRSFSGGEEQAVNFGFKSFQDSGYSFYQMTFKPFNDPTTLGAEGHVYKNSTIFVPMNKEIFGIGERKEKTSVPPMRVNYVKDGDTNREYEQWLTGGTNGTYTNTTDAIQVNFRSHNGFEAFGENRFMVLTGTNS